MPEYILDFELPFGDRASKRCALIEFSLAELPGTGRNENASRYQYNVDAYNNYYIFLKRPTQLNKGFDFTVNISGLYFKKNRRYRNPSHQDIYDALSCCKKQFPNEYTKVMSAITEIYNCNDVDIADVQATFSDHEGNAHPIQIIILAIKWLFMEQDCAYWNYSGREMFYGHIVENELI